MPGCRTAGIPESGGIMVVHCPATVSHKVGETSFRADIVLVENIIADIPSAFAFSGQETDPLQFPVLGSVIALSPSYAIRRKAEAFCFPES